MNLEDKVLQTKYDTVLILIMNQKQIYYENNI